MRELQPPPIVRRVIDLLGEIILPQPTSLDPDQEVGRELYSLINAGSIKSPEQIEAFLSDREESLGINKSQALDFYAQLRASAVAERDLFFN